MINKIIRWANISVADSYIETDVKNAIEMSSKILNKSFKDIKITKKSGSVRL